MLVPANSKLVWLAVALVCAGSSLFILDYPLNHDVGWHLHMARGLLAGESLGETLIEINPPLYAYLATLPAALAGVTGLPIVGVAKLTVLLVSLLIVVWVGNLASFDESEQRYDPPLVTFALALPLLALVGIDFGQREHLMVVLSAPYLVLTARRELPGDVGRATAMAVGVVAAVGFSLKPHFVLLWLGLEGVLFLRSRSLRRTWLRPESVAVQVFLVVYAAYLVLDRPEYLRLLFDAGPVYARFWAVDRLGLLFGNRYFVFLAAVVAAAVVSRPARTRRPFIGVFLIVAPFAFIMAVGQGKGWLYHFFPALAWTTVAAVLIVADFLIAAYRSRQAVTPARMGTVVLVVAIGVLSAGSLVRYHRALAESRFAFLAEHQAYLARHEVRSLLVLSPALPAAFPLVNYADVDWPAPVPSLWWVSALHGTDRPRDGSPPRFSHAGSIERRLRGAFVSSWLRQPPDVVFVDTAPVASGSSRRFPYVDYLSEEPGFAELWEEYERAEGIGRFEVFSRALVRPEEPR